MAKVTNNKTWKRELATLMFFWVGVLSYDIDNLEMVKVLVWPVAAFGAGAFGLDAMSKQLQSNFRSEGPPTG